MNDNSILLLIWLLVFFTYNYVQSISIPAKVIEIGKKHYGTKFDYSTVQMGWGLLVNSEHLTRFPKFVKDARKQRLQKIYRWMFLGYIPILLSLGFLQ